MGIQNKITGLLKGIEQRSDTTFRFTVSIKDSGTKKYEKIRMVFKLENGFKGKKAADYINHCYLEYKSDVLSKNPTIITFEEVSKQYIDVLIKGKHRKLSTLGNREADLKNHILPIIGHIPITKITTFQLDQLMSNLKRVDGGQLAPSSKKVIYHTINGVMKKAVAWGYIDKNPLTGVECPTNKRCKIILKKADFQTIEEVKLVLEALKNEPEYWQVLFILDYYTGIRRGEIVGLEWGQVDFIKNRIYIEKSITAARGYGVVEDGLKTTSSERWIALPVPVMERLKEYQTFWYKQRDNKQDKWRGGQNEYLFHAGLGKPLYPTTPSNHWKEFLKKHSIRHVKLHSIRHTVVSLLLEKNVSIKVISDMLGHSKIGITMDTYGHLQEQTREVPAEALTNIIGII